MDYTQLIYRLRQGELVANIDSENKVLGYTSTAPNKDAIAAANALVKLSAQVQNDMVYIATLTKERDEYYDQLVKLQSTIAESESPA